MANLILLYVAATGVSAAVFWHEEIRTVLLDDLQWPVRGALTALTLIVGVLIGMCWPLYAMSFWTPAKRVQVTEERTTYEQ